MTDAGPPESSEPALGRLGLLLPYFVYVFDVEARSITYLNRDLHELLGYTAEEAAAYGGTGFLGLLHEEDSARLPELLERWASVADGEFLETEYRLRAADGSWRWILGRDTPLERDDQGRVRKVLGTSLDITERKSLEVRLQLSQKLEALGRLAGGIAHDFNNILTAILGNAELARADLGNRAWVGECLEQIRGAAEEAASLTRSLLGFARQQPIRSELVDVNALLVELERLLRRLLGEAIRVEFAIGEGVGAVRIDRAQLTQIVLNLAVNARDAMPEGGRLKITTSVHQVDEGARADLEVGEYVVLEVDDDGVGMDHATLARIFEPFFTTKGEQQGSGLGLATVYGIVHQHRGTIVVRSEPGQGASFTVYLPRVADAPPPRPTTPPPTIAAGGEQATILVVEDAAPVAAILREALTRAGHQVEVIDDGVAAVERILRHDPCELLIVDRNLPGCSGLEVARHARGRWPSTRILVISGYPQDVDAEALAALDAHFLAKPFLPEALLARVQEILVSAARSL
ncbi:MAG: ATP-binding protein [Nannocystaceae bacterium]